MQDPLTGKSVMKISKIINNNVVSTFDEDATANKKDSIVTERKNTLYQEKCTELEEGHAFETRDDVLADLTFDRIYKLNTETAEE